MFFFVEKTQIVICRLVNIINIEHCSRTCIVNPANWMVTTNIPEPAYIVIIYQILHRSNSGCCRRFSYEIKILHEKNFCSSPIKPPMDDSPCMHCPNFPRYNTKCIGGNEILRGIFRVLSRFPLHSWYITEIWITFWTVYHLVKVNSKPEDLELS